MADTRDMPEAWAIRSWLLPNPRPTTLRLTTSKGTEETILCSGQPWAHIAQTVVAMDTVSIHALDAEGRTIRAAKVSDILAELNDDEPASSSTTGEATANNGPLVVPSSFERGMLALFDRCADRIAEAYRHATDVAFDRLVDVVNLQSQANVSMQREMMQARVESRKLEREMFDQAWEQAEANGDGDMFKQFFSAYLQGQTSKFANQVMTPSAGKAGGPPKPPTPSNGKASA